MKSAASVLRSAARLGERGFSMLEFLVSIGVLTVLMGALMSFMGAMQKRYVSEQRVSGINQGGKTGMDLLAMDVGQAGFPPAVNTTTSAAITGSLSGQTVNVGSAVGLYVGRVVMVDIGINSQEAVTLTACTSSASGSGCTSGGNSITGVFKKSHASGVPVRVSAVPYPQGILFSLVTGQDTSTATALKIMGDIRGDGTLRYIEYRYTPPPDDTTPGILVRSDTSAFATAENTAITVVDSLRDASIFTYTITMAACPAPAALPAYVTNCASSSTAGSFTYVTSIGVTMTLRTARAVELGAGGTRTVIFKQQYFTPRNVLDAFNLAADGLQTVLPVAPGTVTGILGQ